MGSGRVVRVFVSAMIVLGGFVLLALRRQATDWLQNAPGRIGHGTRANDQRVITFAGLVGILAGAIGIVANL